MRHSFLAYVAIALLSAGLAAEPALAQVDPVQLPQSEEDATPRGEPIEYKWIRPPIKILVEYNETSALSNAEVSGILSACDYYAESLQYAAEREDWIACVEAELPASHFVVEMDARQSLRRYAK